MHLIARLALILGLAFAVVVPRAVWAAHQIGHEVVHVGAVHHHDDEHGQEALDHGQFNSEQDDQSNDMKPAQHEHAPASSASLALPPGMLIMSGPAISATLHPSLSSRVPDAVAQHTEPRPPRAV